MALRLPSQPEQEKKPGQLVGRGETGASLLQEVEKSTLIRREQLKRHSSLGVLLQPEEGGAEGAACSFLSC